MYHELSYAISEDMPVYPGDPSVTISSDAKVETDGFSAHTLNIGTHACNHIDAPSHMIAGGNSLHNYPINRFMGRGLVIDATNGFSLDVVIHQDIQPHDIVFFQTDMTEKIQSVEYFTTYPVFPAEIAHYLVEKQVSIVGFDMCGPDYEPYNIHKILLGGDVQLLNILHH